MAAINSGQLGACRYDLNAVLPLVCRVRQQQTERDEESPTSPHEGPLSATSSSGPLLVREVSPPSASSSSSGPTSLWARGAPLSVSLEALPPAPPPVPCRRAHSLGDLSHMRPAWQPRRAPPSCASDLDDVCLRALSREQLLRRWRDSERRLLNLLREALREKQALERKLAFLHSALRNKPP